MSSELHQETTKNDERHYDDVEAALTGGTALSRQISVSLTAEQFERLYLQPGGTMAKGDLSKRVGNPTPIGVTAFLVALTSLSIDLMGWGGVTSSAAVAQAGGFTFFTGIPMILSGVGEWIIGNTFPATVFITYGGFWLSAGFLFSPEQGIAAAITSNDYNKGFGIYIACIAAMNLIYLVTSLRTNVVFVALFFFLQVAEFILVAAYINIGNGNLAHVMVQLQVAGAFAFVCALCGWYLLIVLMFGSTGIPISLPVGDLSNFMSTTKKSE